MATGVKNLLIIGDTESGKSTLINRVFSKVIKKVGFVTNEILNGNSRQGFEIQTSNGLMAILAHTNKDSVYKVSNFNVFPANLDRVIDLMPSFSSKDILFIDEIAQMQLFSEKFKEFTLKCLDSENLFIGTLPKNYTDIFIEKIKLRSDCRLLELTPQNRLIVEKNIYDFLGIKS